MFGVAPLHVSWWFASHSILQTTQARVQVFHHANDCVWSSVNQPIEDLPKESLLEQRPHVQHGDVECLRRRTESRDAIGSTHHIHHKSRRLDPSRSKEEENFLNDFPWQRDENQQLSGLIGQPHFKSGQTNRLVTDPLAPVLPVDSFIQWAPFSAVQSVQLRTELHAKTGYVYMCPFRWTPSARTVSTARSHSLAGGR